jgi:hypothetical protein
MLAQLVASVADGKDRDELAHASAPHESGDLALKHAVHTLDRQVELVGDLGYRAAAIGKGLGPHIHDSGSMGVAIDGR